MERTRKTEKIETIAMQKRVEMVECKGEREDRLNNQPVDREGWQQR